MAKQDDYVRYTIRVPADLYARIQDAAGEKSMNAEIIAALEEAYPPPRPLPVSDITMHQFQWYAGSWHPIDGDSWVRFRTGEPPQHVVSRMSDKNNYFVVTVFDVDGTLLNIISHNYVLKDEKYDWAGYDYLTPAEILNYNRLMTATTASSEDENQLRKLRKKMEPAFILPANSVRMLREMLKDIAPDDVLVPLLARVS